MLMPQPPADPYPKRRPLITSSAGHPTPIAAAAPEALRSPDRHLSPATTASGPLPKTRPDLGSAANAQDPRVIDALGQEIGRSAKSFEANVHVPDQLFVSEGTPPSPTLTSCVHHAGRMQ